MPNQKENMYNNLTKDGYKLGTLEEFSTKMSDAKTRSILYNNLTKDGYKLGTLEEFSKIVYNPETNRSETIGQVASKVDKENETTSPIPSVIQEEASAQTASKPASPSSWQQTLDRFAAPTQGAPQVLTPSAQMEWKKNKDSQQVKEASKVLDYKGEGQKQIDAYNKQVQSPYATIPSTTEQAKRSLPDEAEEQKQIDAILGSTIQAAQAKGQEARNKSINTTTNLPVMNTPYAATARGILADKAYNEQITPSNIIGAIQEQIMNQGGQTSGGDVDPVQKEISDKSSRLQAQRIYDYVYQRLLEREIPKDKIQSFFMTMLNSNSLASLAKAAVLDESQRQMRAQAMEYKPELDGVAETTAEVLGMVISPEMLVGGTMGRMAGEKVASMGMSKVASNLGLNQASRMLATNGGQRIISGIVGSAANFATFEPLSYVGNSLGTGQDVTLGGVVTSIGKGAATGLVMGAFSQYVMPLFHNKVSSAITDKVLGKGATAYWTNKVVDYGTDLAGRTAIFGCSSLVQQAATNPNFDLAEEAPKAFMDALATNIGFDIHGAIIKSIQVHDAISKSERTNNIRNFIKKYTTETTKRNEDGSVSPEYKSAITEDRLKEILSKNDKDLTLLEQSIKKDFNDQYKSERYPSAYIDAFLGDHSGNKFAFTKDDIRTANKCGIELNSVEELANELAEMASKDASEGSKYNTDETSSDLAKFMQTSRLGKLLSNDNMTASLRNKIIGAITGRFYDNILVTKVSDVMEEGGAYYVTTYNPTGIVESRKFSNEKSAKNFRESQREASRNGILIYNMIQLEQEMNALNDIEKQKQIAKILFPENPDGFAILNEVIEKAKRGEELNDDETTIVTFYKNRMSRDAKSKNVRNVIDDIAKQFMKEYGMTHEEYFKLINSNYKDLSVAEKNKFRDFSQRIEDALKEMTKTPEQKKVEQTQEQIVDEIITETENKIAEQEALNQVTEYPDENVGMVLSVNKDSKGYSLNQYFEQGTQATDINTIKSDLQALGAKMNPETKAIIDEAFANGNVEEVVKSLNGKMTEEDIQYIATKQAQKGYTYTQVEQAKQKVVEQVNSQYGKVTGKVSRGVVDGKEVTITSQEGDEVAYYINPETGQPEHTTWDKVQNVQTIDLSELVKTRCAEEEARINAEIDHVINHSPETHMDYQKGTSFYTLNEKGEKKLNKVVGVDEDGNVLFGELNDKGEPTDVHALKPEEIKALEDEAYYGSKEETATEEPVVETAPAPEVAETTTPAEVTTPEEPVAETPQAEPEKPVSALDSIPKDDKGKTIWTQAESPEVAAKAMLEVHEGNETDAIDTIDSIIEGAKKALEKANNAKPKASTDPNDIIEEKSKIKKSIEEAKNNLDFWKKVRLELQTSMPEEIDNIANDVVEQKKQASNVAKINAIGLDESASVYDYVLGWIASGAKFKFGNDEHSKGLSSETGYGKNDFGLFMLDSKNGQTPDQMAQTIFESMPERLREQTDDMEIKNHIIDIIGSYKNYTEMADEFVRRNTFDESAHEEYVPEGEANNEPISFENVHQGETHFSVDKNAPEEAPTSPADQLAKMLNITDGRVITERDVNERTAKGSKKRAAAMELLEQANAIRKAEEDIKAQIDAFVNARNEALNEWEEMENLAAQERRAKVEPFIKTLRDELSKYAIEGSVVIVESMNDLPEDMRNHQSILSGNWFAFAHENGKVYVNPYKITSHDTARSKVWHEVVAHKGVSAFVEGQGVNSVDFFNDIYDSLSKPEQKDWLGYVLGYNLNQTQKADVIAMANHHMTYAELLSKDKELAKQCYDRAYNTFFLDDLSAKEQNVLADMYRHQAGDEMVAHLADSQGVSSGFMTKMKAYFNKFARELGNKLGIDMGISESEIKYIIGETAKDMNIKTTAKKGVVLIDKAISDIDSGKAAIPAYKEWLKNNPNDPNGGGKKTATSEGAKFSADYEKAYEEKDEQKASEIVRDAFHVAYPDTKVVDEKGMQKSNPDIRFSYTTDENGRALSERALDAKDNGTYPKMEFRKAYDINGKTFDALKDLHFISNSEWHHTGKNFNQTDFYSWWDSDKAHGSTDYSESYEAGEDLLAKYNANKDKIKSLAEKASKLDWQFKDKESVPEFGMFAHNVAEKEVSLTPEEENMKKNGHVAISNSGEPSAYMRKLEHEDLDNKYYTILSNRRDEYVKEHESELRQMYDEKYGDIIKSNEEIDKYNASTDGKEKALKEIATLMGETPEEATRLVNGVSRTARDQIKRDAEQKDYESRKAEAKVLADKKQKELDKWVQKNISEGKIKVVDRVKKDDLPENFVETKREMYGKYGWFESQPYKYRLPEYYSGYGFESKRTKTAYDNRVQDISNIRNLRFSVDEDIERDVAGRPIMPEFKSVAEAISPEGRARMNAWTEEARKWDMAHPLDVKNRKAAASRVEKLIKTALDDADVDEVTKSKLVSAMKAIKNTGTINLNEQTSKGFKIAASAISKAYEKQIHDLMMLKVRDKNGRGNAVGKKVDAITAQAFEFLRNFYDTKSKKFIVDSAILDAKLTELEEKMSNRIDDSALTDDEAMKEQAQKTAYEILKRVSESNVTATKLQELIENGKSNDERLKELYQLRREGNENYSNDEGETIVVADEITRIKKLQEANDMDINSQMQAKMDAQDVIRTKLADLIEGGRDYKKSKAEAEQDRRRNLVASMMEAIDSDLEITQNDVDTGRYDEEKNLLKKPFSKLWHGVMDTFEYMCKNYATNGVNGENWMYDYFIKGKDGVVQAQSNYEHSMRVHAETLDAKCKEIFGKKFLDVVEDNSKFYKNSGVHVDTDVDKRGENRLGEQGGKRELSLTKGQGTYLYMLWRMNDGNAQLIREGFTEESMEEIANFIGEKNQKFADFMQLEYLPQLREKYNDRYIEVFDTSMAHVDNYVPLRRSKMKRLEGEDFTATGKSNPKVVTKGASALIERVHNTHSIDHTADAFKVLYDHLSEMEEWYNFARVRQDLQYVLNSAAVRNRMNRNDTGSWARFRDAAKSACHVKDGGDMATADHAWSELARTFATSAIAYRYGTALKQTLSLPAFLDYSADPRYLAAFAKNMGIEYGVDIFGFAKTIPTLGTGFKDRLKNRAESQAWFTEGLSKNLAWCMNNIPDFYERVINQATSVDPIMNDKSNLQKTGKLSEDIWYYINKYRDNYAEAGFATNKLVDAATCAIGAKSIYDYKYARLMEGVAKKYKKGVAKKHKEGTPQYENAQKEAHRLAVMDATLAFNSSQQSSHGAFLSPIQREKSFASKMLTLFKNSPMSYSRKLASNIQSLYRCAENMKSGKMTDYYAKRIMLENPKMSEEDARSEANKHIAWESGRATWGIALYGYILPWLWSQGGKGIIGLFQPDEDDNKKTDKELEEEKWQNYSEQAGFIFDGVPSVSVAMDIARITANVSQDWSINTSNSGLAMINDALKEGKRVYDEQGMISPQMASLIISKSAKIGSGFDINTWSNIGIGLAGLAKDGYIGAKDLITGEDSDPKSFENCLIDLMFIMNSPKSQRVKLAKDFYKDMPYAEYEKAVKLASEYYTDTLPYVSWLPQNKMVKEKKAKEMYEEFLRYHSADGSAQKRVEDKDAVKEINSEREAISSDKKLDNYIKSTDRYEEFNQYRDKMADFSVLTATHQTWVSLMRTNPTKAREYKQEHMDDIKKYERLYGKYAQAKSLIGRLGDKPEKDDELFNKAMKLLEE